jgi:uroporphyrin-III C-methyltransferase
MDLGRKPEKFDILLPPFSLMTAQASRPLPCSGASLLLAFSPPSADAVPSRRTVLIIGSARLASVRAIACLEAGMRVVVAHSSLAEDDIDTELAFLASRSLITLVPASLATGDSLRSFLLEAYPELYDDLLIILVTDSLLLSHACRSYASALSLRKAAHNLRLPLSIADYPALSDFTFPSTHRFAISKSDLTPSPLQVALTTNSNSCRLASRLRRHIVSSLPQNAGGAVRRVGELRAKLGRDLVEPEGEESSLSRPLNAPVEQLSVSRCRKMKRAKTAGEDVPSAVSMERVQRVPDADFLCTPPATPPTSRLGDDSSPCELATETKMRFIAQIC